MSEIKDVERLKSKIRQIISEFKDHLHDNRARKNHKISAYENALAHIEDYEVGDNQITFDDFREYWKQQQNFVKVQDFEEAARLYARNGLYGKFDDGFDKITDESISTLLNGFENNIYYKKEK